MSRSVVSATILLGCLGCAACVEEPVGAVVPPPAPVVAPVVYAAPPPPPPVRREPPPPPPPAPRLVWQPGVWEWTGAAYVWRPGHYVAVQPRHWRWIPGHWARSRGQPVWIASHWG
ncbi:MAG: YXWGXW repeat-containing protein [Gluconacetobacter diazotrophicus]|nr:YXWGXW repeat-containing protein [Gluconacetobacter diazotrophicus]